MTVDSTAAGYLGPVGSQQPEDEALDDILTLIIVGITGIDPTMVVPKWQGIPDAEPSKPTDWCAFGVTDVTADTNVNDIHDGAAVGGLGQSAQTRTEFLSVMVSFYGTNARAYASLLRDGLHVAQNRDALRAAKIGYANVETLRYVPTNINNEFRRQVDLTINLRRTVLRIYPIRNVDSLAGQVVSDVGVTSSLSKTGT